MARETTLPPLRIPRRLLRVTAARVAGLLVIVGVVSLIGAAVLRAERGDHRRAREADAQAVATGQAAGAAQAIGALLIEAQQTGDDIVRRLNSGEIAPESEPEVLRTTLEAHPLFWGLGITYDPRPATAPAEPNHYDTLPGGQINEGRITYDYTDPADPRSHWWRRGYDVGSTWVPPYLGGTTRKMVALYVSRFYGPNAPPDGSPAGVILVSIQLDTFNREVGWSELGASGYGFIVSRSGSYAYHPSGGRDGGFVAHPEKAYWRGANAPTFFEVVQANGNAQAERALDPNVGGIRGFVDYRDEITGRDAWLFYEPIPSADWVLGSVVIKEVVLGGDATDFHFLVWIGLLIINGLAAIGAACAIVLLRGQRRLWTTVTVVTLAPALGMGLIWLIVAQRASEPAVDIDGVSLREAAANYSQYVSTVASDLAPETVLAGIFTQAIEPADRGDWRVSGTVWQRYVNGVPDGVEPGFIFPDAVTPPAFDLSHDVTDGAVRTVGWRFSATIRPEYNFSRYPLDEALLTIRMAHRQIDKPIVLLPDVGEYDLIVPTSRPGLAPGIDVGGFTLRDSYFGYRAEDLNSTLGIPNFSRQTGAPELTFTARMERGFVSPFLSQMLPLIVVSGLLFAVHLMMTSHGERQRAWGATTTSTVGAVGGLLFVSILSHNGLRAALGASDIIYLEYAYFIVYGALLAVALNSILFAAGRGGPLILWHDNVIPKLAYWPLITTAMFVVTLAVFY
ncbi:MAG: hypothetical protein WEB13_01465 [Dehalococcoidia bacterium]